MTEIYKVQLWLWRESCVLGNLVKAVPLQVWSGPECSRKLRFPDLLTTAQDGGKVVSHMHQPHLPPGNSPGTHLCSRLSWPQGHSAIRRIYLNEKFHDTIWDRTSDLLICSAVPPKQCQKCEIWYSHSDVTKNLSVLECDTVWAVPWRTVVPSSSTSRSLRRYHDLSKYLTVLSQ
jgi:hypothetical protein